MRTKCRLIIMLILIFCIGLLSCQVVLAEEVFTSDKQLMIEATDNGLWICDGAELSYLNTEKKDRQSVISFDKIVGMSADENDGLVGLLIDNGDTQEIAVVDVDGRIYYRFELPEDTRFVDICKNMESIYLINDAGDTYRVFIDGEYPPERLEYAGSGAIAIGMYNGLLYEVYGTGDVVIFDGSGEEAAHWQSEGVVSVLPFPYAAGKYPAAVWYEGGEQICIIDLETGEETMPSIEFDENCGYIDFDSSTIYMLSADLKTLSSASLVDESADNTLYLINFIEDLGRGRGKQAVEMFNVKYPGVKIINRWIDDPRDLDTAIMSGDSQMDVLFIQENMLMSSSLHYFKAGATLPLDSFECIQNLPWDSYTFRRETFTAERGLFALPDTIDTFAWAVNSLLAEEIGIEIPEYGWSWQDFFDMANEVERYNAENGTEWLLLNDASFSIPALFRQYGAENNDIWNGSANYDNEYFIKLVGQWLSAYERGLVATDADFRFMPEENALFTAGSYINSNNMRSMEWVMPPMLEDGYAFPIVAMTLQLYSGSKHPDMAAYFIACYMSEEALTAVSTYLTPSILVKDLSKYPEYEYFFDPADVLSDENFELWCNALRDGEFLIYYWDLYRDQGNEFYPALINGEMTPEEFAFVCQQRADMVIGE